MARVRRVGAEAGARRLRGGITSSEPVVPAPSFDYEAKRWGAARLRPRPWYMNGLKLRYLLADLPSRSRARARRGMRSGLGGQSREGRAAGPRGVRVRPEPLGARGGYWSSRAASSSGSALLKDCRLRTASSTSSGSSTCWSTSTRPRRCLPRWREC